MNCFLLRSEQVSILTTCIYRSTGDMNWFNKTKKDMEGMLGKEIFGKEMEQLDLTHPAGGNIKWNNLFENRLTISEKVPG